MKNACCALNIAADCCCTASGGGRGRREATRDLEAVRGDLEVVREEEASREVPECLSNANYPTGREISGMISGSLELPFEIPRGNNPLLDPVCEESFDAELLFVEKVGLAHTALLAIRRGAEGKLKEALDQLSFTEPEISYRHFIDSLIKKRFPNSRYWWKVELWLLTPAGHNSIGEGKPPLEIHQAIALQKHMMFLQKRLAMRWHRPRIQESSVFIPSFLAKIDLKEAERIIKLPNFSTLSLESIFCILISAQTTIIPSSAEDQIIPPPLIFGTEKTHTFASTI